LDNDGGSRLGTKSNERISFRQDDLGSTGDRQVIWVDVEVFGNHIVEDLPGRVEFSLVEWSRGLIEELDPD